MVGALVNVSQGVSPNREGLVEAGVESIQIWVSDSAGVLGSVPVREMAP